MNEKRILIYGFIFILIAFSLKFAFSSAAWLLNSQSNILLFNHEVTSIDNHIYPSASSVHSFFPGSFILSKICFLIIPSPSFVELIIPTITEVILSLLFFAFLVRSFKKESSLLFIVLAFGCLLLFYLGANTNVFWFRSIALFQIIPLLILFMNKKSNNNWGGNYGLLFSLIFLSMIISDDGIIEYAFIAFLLISYFIGKKKDIQGIIPIAIILFVTYQGIVGFVGQIYYGAWDKTILILFQSFFSIGNFSSHAAATTYPEYSIIGQGISFLVLFGIIPLLLMIPIVVKKNKALIVLLLPAALLLSAGDALRVANVLTPSIMGISSIYTLALYLFFPLALFAIIKSLKNYKIPVMQGINVKKLVFLVSFCIILTMILVPTALPVGPITKTSDLRLWPIVESAGTFAEQFSDAKTYVYAPEIGDMNVLLFDSGAPSVNSQIVTIISVYSQAPDAAKDNLIYNSGSFYLQTDFRG